MKKLSVGLILFAVALVAVVTAYKVVTNHNNNLMKVTEKRIMEAAINCWRDDKCSGNVATLDTLYQNKYLEQEINPLTKEIYNPSSYVKKDGNNYEFIIVD